MGVESLEVGMDPCESSHPPPLRLESGAFIVVVLARSAATSQGPWTSRAEVVLGACLRCARSVLRACLGRARGVLRPFLWRARWVFGGLHEPCLKRARGVLNGVLKSQH